MYRDLLIQIEMEFNKIFVIFVVKQQSRGNKTFSNFFQPPMNLKHGQQIKPIAAK